MDQCNTDFLSNCIGCRRGSELLISIQGAIKPMQADINDDLIDLEPYLRAFYRNKGKGIIIIFVCAVMGLLSSFAIRPIYRAESVLSYNATRDFSNASVLGQRVGGLASLGGVFGMPGMNSSMEVDIAIIKSRNFARKFVAANQLEKELIAQEWKIIAQKSSPKIDIFDESSSEFTTKGRRLIDQDFATRKFIKLLGVDNDKRTNLVNIYLDWPNREESSALLEKYIASANAFIRKSDIETARKNIDFLEEQIGKTNVAELRKSFYELIESQQKTIMVANSRPDYAFRMIDPPFKPFKPEKPLRRLFIAGGIFAGLFLYFLGCTLLVIRSEKQKCQTPSIDN